MARVVLQRGDAVPLIAEVFRELGYDGATLSALTSRTGLSKGSLYHFFPGGKEEMAAAVLTHVDAWFRDEVFLPLERDAPRPAIARMWQASDLYFRSGRRVCLVGAFALEETRDRFAQAIRLYFLRWIEALAGALARAGLHRQDAEALARECVGGIQGALVLARALDEPRLFSDIVGALAARVERRIDAQTNG